MSKQTPTTDHGNSSFPEQIVGQAMISESYGKADTVVSKLVYSWRKLIGAECNFSKCSDLQTNLAEEIAGKFITIHPKKSNFLVSKVFN